MRYKLVIISVPHPSTLTNRLCSSVLEELTQATDDHFVQTVESWKCLGIYIPHSHPRP